MRPRRRRLVYAAAAALVLAAAGTAATLLILDRGDSPGEAGRPASNEITAAAAWRLVISNKIGANGCIVTVTNTDTGDQKVFENIWGTKTFQAPWVAYGADLGLAFQITDDLLDVVGSEKELGKRVGKDSGRGKATFPGLLGVEESRRRAEARVERATAALAPLGSAATGLEALARYVLDRNQ